eukprot:2057728-Amphidinium_carterae.1
MFTARVDNFAWSKPLTVLEGLTLFFINLCFGGAMNGCGASRGESILQNLRLRHVEDCDHKEQNPLHQSNPKDSCSYSADPVHRSINQISHNSHLQGPRDVMSFQSFGPHEDKHLYCHMLNVRTRSTPTRQAC